MSFIRSTLTVGALTLCSRVLGFTRDILTAALLGTGPLADAFFVALKLPNFFRRVTAEGAFSVSFIPLFSKSIETEGDKEAEKFANEALSVMLVIMVPFVALAILFMPQVINLIAPGFGEGSVENIGRYNAAVEMSRITFPYILFMSIVALIGGVLNSFDRFSPFAAAPILFNISLITALLFGGGLAKTLGHAMAWGVFFAGILQFFLVYFFTFKTSVRLKLIWPRFSDKIRRLFRLMGPGVIGASVVQINLLVDIILASLLPTGAISYLYFADRLNQLPLGLVGIAIGTTLLPKLSKALTQEGDRAEDIYNQAIKFSAALVIPAAIALIIIPEALTHGLFQRGEFDVIAAQETARAIMAYALGLPAYIAIKVFATAFYAHENTKTPVIFAIIAAVINIILSLALIGPLGHVGIALATSVAAIVQGLLLYIAISRKSHLKINQASLALIKQVILFSAVMGAVLYAAQETVRPMMMDGGLTAIAIMLGLVVIGKIVYFCLLIGSGTMKLNELKRLIKKPQKG